MQQKVFAGVLNDNSLPCAAPDRSTELDSDVKVCINHGSKSSKLLSPIPLTIAPNARADTLRT